MVFVVVGQMQQEQRFVIDYIFFVNVFCSSCNDIFARGREDGSSGQGAPRSDQRSAGERSGSDERSDVFCFMTVRVE